MVFGFYFTAVLALVGFPNITSLKIDFAVNVIPVSYTHLDVYKRQDMMSATQIHQKLEKGYADIEKGNVEDAASAFVAFRERH